MNIMFAGMIGGWEVIVILAVVLILFGSKKLPELARGLGQGIREFKKATREVTDEIQNASDVDTQSQPQRRLPVNNPTPVDQRVVSQSTSTVEQPKA
jgi:sec-independent protein translocase protein TatA